MTRTHMYDQTVELHHIRSTRDDSSKFDFAFFWYRPIKLLPYCGAAGILF